MIGQPAGWAKGHRPAVLFYQSPHSEPLSKHEVCLSWLDYGAHYKLAEPLSPISKCLAFPESIFKLAEPQNYALRQVSILPGPQLYTVCPSKLPGNRATDRTMRCGCAAAAASDGSDRRDSGRSDLLALTS
eukprot:762820-Hanusia_phi.AAC.11